MGKRCPFCVRCCYNTTRVLVLRLARSALAVGLRRPEIIAPGQGNSTMIFLFSTTVTTTHATLLAGDLVLLSIYNWYSRYSYDSELGAVRALWAHGWLTGYISTIYAKQTRPLPFACSNVRTGCVKLLYFYSNHTYNHRYF